MITPFAKQLVEALWTPRTVEDAWEKCQELLDQHEALSITNERPCDVDGESLDEKGYGI